MSHWSSPLDSAESSESSESARGAEGPALERGVSLPRDIDVSLLSRSAMLCHLPEQALAAMFAARVVRLLRDGEVLVEDEARVSQAWLVAAGTVKPAKLRAATGLVAAEAGVLIDKVAVVLGGTHEASWIAQGSAMVVGFPIALLHSFERSYPEHWAKLIEHANTLMLQNALRLALRSALPLCDPAPMLERAFSEGLWWHMARGEALFSEGDALDGWYVLVSGELAETSSGLGQALIHSTLRAGNLVGASAMLAGQAYSSTVVARRDAWLLRLDASDFESLVLAHPQTVQAVARHAIRRATNKRKVTDLDATVAVIPSCTEASETLILDLIGELERLGPLSVLDAALCEAKGIVRDVAGRERADLAWLRLEAWTDAQHQRGRRVLLIGDARDSSWSLHAARAADRVLLIADATQALPSEFPAAWQAVQADIALQAKHASSDTLRWQPQNWLCLLHPRDCKRPQGTARWLNAFNPSKHFHVRAGRLTDLARLARHLAGQAIGLALSGGGGRGPAHAGVFRALEEAGIPIDFVAGTSAGALMTCLFTQDEGWQSCAERAIEGIGPAPGPFSDLTVPVVSLIKSQRLHDLVRGTYGEERLEDSWIPCATVATNLSKLARVVYTRGASWQVTLAGVSPPGVAKPRVVDGDLICDGGLIDNMPVSVLLEHGCRHVISVNISTEQTLKLEGDDFPSPWAILADRMLRGGRKTAGIPTSIDILLAATTLASEDARQLAASWTDLQISPDLKRFKTTDFMRGPELVTQGYADGKLAIAQHEREEAGSAFWALVNLYRYQSTPSPRVKPF